MNNELKEALTAVTPTEAQEALMKEVGDRLADKYIGRLYRPGIDIEAVTPMIRNIYGYFELTMPEIVVCKSPLDMIERARAGGVANPVTDRTGASDSSWVSRLDMLKEAGLLTEEEVEIADPMINMVVGGVYDTLLCKEAALICGNPESLSTNAAGDLHSAVGPAIAWDGYAEWAWNGVFVPREVIESPADMTPEAVLALSTEQRRAYGEHYGWDKTLSKLGMELEDTWKDEDTGLSYELFASADKTIKVIRKESPRLQDDSQPWYVEPVHHELTSAQAARKWQAACRRGSNPSDVARDCNRDPVLRYGQET